MICFTCKHSIFRTVKITFGIKSDPRHESRQMPVKCLLDQNRFEADDDVLACNRWARDPNIAVKEAFQEQEK